MKNLCIISISKENVFKCSLKAWPWTIMGDVFGECHAPCTKKTPNLVFEKEKANTATKGLIFRPYPSLPYNSGSRKPLPCCVPSHPFFDIHICRTCSRPEYA